MEARIGAEEIAIVGLTADSRQVRPGFLFAALPGVHADGREFIADALRNGAVAVLAPPGTRLPVSDVSLVVDENPRRGLALMAARFYHRQPATIAAVTGTNGKTSVAWFLSQIWTALGHPAACLGTLGLFAPGIVEKGSLTTPDPVALHRQLARLGAQGIEHLVLEASSHGLDQHRLDGVRVTAAAFTNLSRDHLDYHGSIEAYLTAKLRLFADLLIDGGTAVVNIDAEHGGRVLAVVRERRLAALTYGADAAADLRLLGALPGADGQRLDVILRGRTRAAVDLPLAGAFQASNALCAAGLALACGADADRVLAALAGLQPVPGRLQRVAVRDGAAVYVDYAHTPDALANVLAALRPFCRGRLTVVFGCGGDRDPGKRAPMGAIAARLADRVVVTDDNPRGEAPAAIRAAILAGCPDAREIGDRAEAIAAAIAGLAPGDVLLVAGKGHETGQIIGDRVLPFDDADVVRAIVAEGAP